MKNNKNKANDCKNKSQSPKANNCNKAEDKNQKSMTFKSSMENSDY